MGLSLGLTKLIGTERLKAYMHGFFIDMKMYNEVSYPLVSMFTNDKGPSHCSTFWIWWIQESKNKRKVRERSGNENFRKEETSKSEC